MRRTLALVPLVVSGHGGRLPVLRVRRRGRRRGRRWVGRLGRGRRRGVARSGRGGLLAHAVSLPTDARCSTAVKTPGSPGPGRGGRGGRGGRAPPPPAP